MGRPQPLPPPPTHPDPHTMNTQGKQTRQALTRGVECATPLFAAPAWSEPLVILTSVVERRKE